MRGKPKLFVGTRATRALEMLRQIARHTPPGLPHPYTPALWNDQGDPIRVWGSTFDVAGQHRTLYRLQWCKWVECGPFGPRGGKRWRITEEGEKILTVADNYPPGSEAMRLAFALIGENPRR